MNECCTILRHFKFLDQVLRDADSKKKEYENRLSKMVEIVHKLEEENKELGKKVAKAEQDLYLSKIIFEKSNCDVTVDISENAAATTSIHNISGEVDCLKDRLQVIW